MALESVATVASKRASYADVASDARARVGPDSIGACGPLRVARVRVLVALVNIGAVDVVPVPLGRVDLHKAEAVLARARVAAVGVGALGIWRTRGGCGRRHRLSDGALVDVGAEQPIPPVALARAGAVEAARRVVAVCKGRAARRAKRALVDVHAVHAVTRVTRGARAREGACGVGTVGRVEAVVRAGGALVDLGARVRRGDVAALARARAADEVRCLRWARRAARGRAAAACVARAVARTARRSARCKVLRRADGEARAPVQVRREGGAREALARGRAATGGAPQIAAVADLIGVGVGAARARGDAGGSRLVRLGARARDAVGALAAAARAAVGVATHAARSELKVAV